MRDLETIAATLTMAETGHLVFGTLHANDTAQAIDRIVDVFPPQQQRQIQIQLSQTLAAVIHQRLVPRADGTGRVAAFEVMLGTPAIRNLIKEGKSNQLRNVVATGSSFGMYTLEADLRRLVREGVISMETATAETIHPERARRARRPRRQGNAPPDRGGAFRVICEVGERAPDARPAQPVSCNRRSRRPRRARRRSRCTSPWSWPGGCSSATGLRRPRPTGQGREGVRGRGLGRDGDDVVLGEHGVHGGLDGAKLLGAGVGLRGRGQPDEARRDDGCQDPQDRDHDEQLHEGEAPLIPVRPAQRSDHRCLLPWCGGARFPGPVSKSPSGEISP